MMNRIRTLIVDDEPAARDTIRMLLKDDAEFHLIGESADGVSALAAIRDQAPELLFLDVQMPAMDGFTLLRKLDAALLPVVVFVTAYDRYALRAFDAHALDYLLKPFDDDRFRRTVMRAKEQVRQARLGRVSLELRALLEDAVRPSASARAAPHLQRLVVKAGGRSTVLAVSDIDWIEADGDYVQIHLGRACHRLRETMTHLEGQLAADQFVRIHRSVMVNIERIKELQPFFRGDQVVVLRDGTNLRLSRGYKTHLEKALGPEF
jgi:two-component system, LytTR family, response regulator